LSSTNKISASVNERAYIDIAGGYSYLIKRV